MAAAAALLALTGCDEPGEATSMNPPAASAATAVPVGFDLDDVTISPTDGGTQSLRVWVADSTDERARGLMDVTDLGEAAGMLFVFDDTAVRRFYMWRTSMPLDIAFFAADGTFIGSATMEPCLEPSADLCARYAPADPFLVALEVPAGALADLGIGPGARLDR
jgi:uncharacterized membrane protein (UPF0127 family)